MAFNSEGKPCGTGRGYTKFKYTYQDIAEATGLKIGTVRKYKSRGLFEADNFVSVVDFVARYRRWDNTQPQRT